MPVLSLFSKRKMRIIQLPQLLFRTSTLLEEGYTFAECIEMLIPYHIKNASQWENALERAFKDGAGPSVIFSLMGMKKQHLLSLELAEMTGNLSKTLYTVGEQIRFSEETRHRMIKLLVYPLFLFVLIVGLFIAFRIKFLPNIQAMLLTRTGYSESSSIQWSKFFLHMPDYIITLALVAAGLLTAGSVYVSRKRVDLQLAIFLKVPFVRYYWRLLITRQFSRTLGELLLTGFSLQAALAHMAEQPHQKQIAYISAFVRQRIVYGDSLAQATVVAGFFYPKFEQFITHGELSGLLGREMILYAELLESKLQNGIKLLSQTIQPLLFIIIALCIVAAYLSILLPMYNMLDVI